MRFTCKNRTLKQLNDLLRAELWRSVANKQFLSSLLSQDRSVLGFTPASKSVEVNLYTQ